MNIVNSNEVRDSVQGTVKPPIPYSALWKTLTGQGQREKKPTIIRKQSSPAKRAQGLGNGPGKESGY